MGHRPPLLIKIAPDLSSKDKEDIAAVVMRQEASAFPQTVYIIAWLYRVVQMD